MIRQGSIGSAVVMPLGVELWLLMQNIFQCIYELKKVKTNLKVMDDFVKTPRDLFSLSSRLQTMNTHIRHFE